MENNLKNSIITLSKKSFVDFKEHIDNSIKLNDKSSIYIFNILNKLLKDYSSELGGDKFFYLEKLFYCSLELKLLDVSSNILNKLKNQFGDELKIKRLYANYLEVDNNEENLSKAIKIYKALIKSNQEDKATLREYLTFMKLQCEPKTYIEHVNEYLEVYMDDFDVWYELADIYISNNNLNKAIFCLEEVILHHPNNYKIYNKIGDLLASFNNSESANNAIKYYSQSALIKPTPAAFWGILYSLNIIYKANKNFDEKQQKVYSIAKENIENMYKNLKIDNFYQFA
jgi:tetratricopeptide (TPR) repeat protein